MPNPINQNSIRLEQPTRKSFDLPTFRDTLSSDNKLTIRKILEASIDLI